MPGPSPSRTRCWPPAGPVRPPPSAGSTGPSRIGPVGSPRRWTGWSGRPTGRVGSCAVPTRPSTRPDDPVEALWQACTTLREHRGDGHVAALTAAGLDGCQALVLFALSEEPRRRRCSSTTGVGRPTSGRRPGRRWRPAAWWRASRMHPTGAELRRSIEETTDRLAARPFESLGEARRPTSTGISPGWRRRSRRGEIPFPNPMGLPAPGDPDRHRGHGTARRWHGEAPPRSGISRRAGPGRRRGQSPFGPRPSVSGATPRRPSPRRRRR